MERSGIFLFGRIAAVQSQGIQTAHRYIQLLQAGLHSVGVPKRSKDEGQVWFARGRLSRRAQTGPISRQERGRIPKANLAATRQAVARHPGQRLDQKERTEVMPTDASG